MRKDNAIGVDCKVLVNVDINQEAKISRSEFLEKVRYVEQIRTRLNHRYVSFYITSLEEYQNLQRFHELVNEGKFDFSGNYDFVFAVGIPSKLYDWFKNNKFCVIEKQIVNWLAATYYFDIDGKKSIMEEQFYSLLLEEIFEIINKHYSSYESPLKGINSSQIGDEEYADLLLKESQAQIDKYHEVSKTLCGAPPPKFLIKPCSYEHLTEFGINKHFGFDIWVSYFLEKDWNYIVINDGNDDLFRLESRTDFWDKWKHTFATYETKKSFVYEFFFEQFKEEKLDTREIEIAKDPPPDNLERIKMIDSSMNNIKLELEGLKATEKLLIEKCNDFQQQAVICSDAGQKFALKKQLEEIEDELADVREKIRMSSTLVSKR